ncbi:MAG: cell division protein FtsZ, partial [Cyanobacteria bacterium J06576_12]
GILTIAVVTKPFFFEGEQRAKIASQGSNALSKEVDAIIVIPNDRILTSTSKDTSFKDAFAQCDEILRQSVEGIFELITTPGVINIDFADIRATMTDAGPAFMGIGTATGEKRAEEAALKAINSPLLDIAIDGAKGVLFAITGGDDLTMHEVQEAAKIITESIEKDARVIFGSIRDSSIPENEIKVTVIATGFPANNPKRKPNPELQEIKGSHSQSNTSSTAEEVTPNSKKVSISKKDTPSESTVIISKPSSPSDSSLDSSSDDLGIDAEEEEWGSVPSFLRPRRR